MRRIDREEYPLRHGTAPLTDRRPKYAPYFSFFPAPAHGPGDEQGFELVLSNDTDAATDSDGDRAGYQTGYLKDLFFPQREESGVEKWVSFREMLRMGKIHSRRSAGG